MWYTEQLALMAVARSNLAAALDDHVLIVGALGRLPLDDTLHYINVKWANWNITSGLPKCQNKNACVH